MDIRGVLKKWVTEGISDIARMALKKEHREGKKLFSSPGYTASFGGELADFAEAILDDKPLAAEPEFALGELRTALALYRSAETRHWEKVWQ